MSAISIAACSADEQFRLLAHIDTLNQRLCALSRAIRTSGGATAARDVKPGTSWAFRDHRTMTQVMEAGD